MQYSKFVNIRSDSMESNTSFNSQDLQGRNSLHVINHLRDQIPEWCQEWVVTATVM